MAYYCEHCRLVARRRYANCPSCGGGLTSDGRSCADFVRMGYRIVGSRSTSTPSREPISSRGDSIHICDDDTLARLRRGYQESFYQCETPEISSFSYGDETMQDNIDQPDSGAESFFSRYSSASAAPVQESGPQPDEPFVYIPPEPLPQPRQRICPDFSSFGYGLMTILRAIPWRLVFTLLILVAVVGVVMTIWNMRYVIVNSILSFLIELIPIFLVIGGIVYLFKSIFR